MLVANSRRHVQQTAPVAQHRPILDGTAFAAPRQMPTARARDAADQHVARAHAVTRADSRDVALSTYPSKIVAPLLMMRSGISHSCTTQRSVDLRS
jgi:hypothetical protein